VNLQNIRFKITNLFSNSIKRISKLSPVLSAAILYYQNKSSFIVYVIIVYVIIVYVIIVYVIIVYVIIVYVIIVYVIIVYVIIVYVIIL